MFPYNLEFSLPEIRDKEFLAGIDNLKPWTRSIRVTQLQSGKTITELLMTPLLCLPSKVSRPLESVR